MRFALPSIGASVGDALRPAEKKTIIASRGLMRALRRFINFFCNRYALISGIYIRGNYLEYYMFCISRQKLLIVFFQLFANADVLVEH